MRNQTSLEFVLILSAISALMLTAIIYYGKDSGAYAQNESRYANATLLQGASALKANSAGLISSINQTSVVGKEAAINLLLYGCSLGYANISISSNSSSILYGSLQKTEFNGTRSITDYFMPAKSGLVAINISYSISCAGQQSIGAYLLSSFSQSIPSSTNNGTSIQPPAQFSAYISQRNESLLYANISAVPIYALGESSHCTYSTFSGTPLPASDQCPYGDSWDYQVFSSSCYESGSGQTETYCIYPLQTGSYLKSPNSQNYAYKYNFSLGIYNGASAYFSTINSSSKTSPVIYNGASIGTANVTGVYAQPYYPNAELMSNSTSSKFANSSAVNSYEQAQTSAFSTFSFYNNTAGDQGSIQQQFTEFNNVAQQLLTSKGSSIEGCALAGNSLICNPPYPFQYSISVSLPPGAAQNQTLYAEGSIITLKSG